MQGVKAKKGELALCQHREKQYKDRKLDLERERNSLQDRRLEARAKADKLVDQQRGLQDSIQQLESKART